MNLDPHADIAANPDLVKLPVKAPKPVATSALIERLVTQFGARWVDAASVDSWAAEGGDRVVLFAGDSVQFPEGLDVAVVLPELQRASPVKFEIGVVAREHEDALARRFGSQRWPTLLFLRDGRYVTTVSGMHDWDIFVDRVAQALAMPVSRAPTIGIPVVGAHAGGSACH
jgi:hydrogenase-1 operon protein HyaE